MWARPVAPESGRVVTPGLDQTDLLKRLLALVADLLYQEPTEARRHLITIGEQLDPDRHVSLDIERQRLLAALLNLQNDYAGALENYVEASQRARLEGAHLLELHIATGLVAAQLNLRQPVAAAATLDRAYQLAEQHQPEYSWRLAVREGFLHLQLGDAESALARFVAAREELPVLTPGSSTAAEAYYAALLYAGFGQLYAQGQDFERSIEAYLKVVQLCTEHRLAGRLPYHHLDLGRAYMAHQQREAAEQHFRLAIEVSGAHDRVVLGAASANLGYYALLDGDWNQATRRFDAAEHHYRTAGAGFDSDLAMVHLWRSRIAIGQRDDRAASEHLRLSLAAAQRGYDLQRMAAVTEAVAEFYAERGMFEEAYRSRLAHEDALEQFNEQNARQRLDELEIRHELEERRRDAELNQLKAVRLQLKALRAQMNPHFIFNALNSIQEFVTSGKTTEAATHLAHFARLMRQSLNYSEQETISLEEEVDFLRNYIELNVNLRFNQEISYAVEVADDLEDDLIRLPAMLVQPYVENAIEHGLRQVECGRITIAFSHPEDDDERLRVVIADNGIGRAAAAKQRSSSLRSSGREDHRSMGTAITRRRLELLNAGLSNPGGINGTEGEPDAQATVAYEDLYQQDGQPAGTRVTVELPITYGS